MEIHSDYTEPTTSALSFENVSFIKAEDSGYHTFTPSSLDCAEISNEFIDQPITSKTITGQIHFGYFHVTPELNIHRRYTHSTANNGSLLDTPPFRRGCKRPHSSTTEKADTCNNSAPTPTSFIAGKIQNLDVNESKENSDILSPVTSQCSDKYKKRLLYQHDFETLHSYPTTPVKKNCKQSPCRKPGRQLNFVIHSLSCDSNVLQHKNSSKRDLCKAVKAIDFWPRDHKIDIIEKLYVEALAMPPIMKILSYLSNKDIHNFSKVSKAWNNVWESVSNNNKKKKDYERYLKTAKENQENRDKGAITKLNSMKPARPLRETHNEGLGIPVKCTTGPSPPGSPRTNKFKKFTKSASLDHRSQLSCVRCCQPAKVTIEASGEVWVDCTSNSCLYQYCKFCKCPRHKGKSCFQYDLNGPSPSKRKKIQYAVGTKKSKRNLLRL